MLSKCNTGKLGTGISCVGWTIIKRVVHKKCQYDYLTRLV